MNTLIDEYFGKRWIWELLSSPKQTKNLESVSPGYPSIPDDWVSWVRLIKMALPQGYSGQNHVSPPMNIRGV
ncbi:MAG: hypothetical protein OEW26_02665, partial [Nitrospirota bacterium]|nr:hypothetical protein [Nitrospirota bacterium]